MHDELHHSDFAFKFIVFRTHLFARAFVCRHKTFVLRQNSSVLMQQRSQLPPPQHHHLNTIRISATADPIVSTAASHRSIVVGGDKLSISTIVVFLHQLIVQLVQRLFGAMFNVVVSVAAEAGADDDEFDDDDDAANDDDDATKTMYESICERMTSRDEEGTAPTMLSSSISSSSMHVRESELCKTTKKQRPKKVHLLKKCKKSSGDENTATAAKANELVRSKSSSSAPKTVSVSAISGGKQQQVALSISADKRVKTAKTLAEISMLSAFTQCAHEHTQPPLQQRPDASTSDAEIARNDAKLATACALSTTRKAMEGEHFVPQHINLSTLDHSNNDESDEKDDDTEDLVTPWNVAASAVSGVDYNRLIEKFGCQRVNAEQIRRLETLTGVRAHPMVRRGLFFAQRDLDNVLQHVEQRKPVYLYTGRGPSSGSLHLGHLVPFMFAKSLQEQLNVPLVIQITDDEKYLWKDMTLAQVKTMAIENIKDIIACGFDPEKTFIFLNTEYMRPAFYQNVLKIWRSVTNNQARGLFGFAGEDSIGKTAFPAFEAAPCFSSSFPEIFNDRQDILCLIPCAIDQDPFFRMTRDVAPRLGCPKPSMLYSSFLPALQGAQSKMAASQENTCIYISDTPKQIRNKINKYAFSGGCATVEEHRSRGGRADVDTAFQFLRFFLDDDDELERVRAAYTSGALLSGELKARAIDVVQRVVADVQRRREAVTDDDVARFTAIRKLPAFDYEKTAGK